MIKLSRLFRKTDVVQTLIFFSNFLASKREKRFSSLTREKRFGMMTKAKTLVPIAGGSLKSGA